MLWMLNVLFHVANLVPGYLRCCGSVYLEYATCQLEENTVFNIQSLQNWESLCENCFEKQKNQWIKLQFPFRYVCLSGWWRWQGWEKIEVNLHRGWNLLDGAPFWAGPGLDQPPAGVECNNNRTQCSGPVVQVWEHHLVQVHDTCFGLPQKRVSFKQTAECKMAEFSPLSVAILMGILPYVETRVMIWRDLRRCTFPSRVWKREKKVAEEQDLKSEDQDRSLTAFSRDDINRSSGPSRTSRGTKGRLFPKSSSFYRPAFDISWPPISSYWT